MTRRPHSLHRSAPGRRRRRGAAAIDRVIARGWFVLGPEVEAFEAEFAAACGAAHAVGVGNGTDAIALLLRALGHRPGDEVIVPAITAAYTALAVILAGANAGLRRRGPRDADDRSRRVRGRDYVADEGDRAGAPVRPAGCHADAAHRSPRATSLAIVEDCCQAHLATCDGVPVGTPSAGGAFSFYPTKNLGALGDGGAVITGDAQLAAAHPAPAQRRPDAIATTTSMPA